MLIDEPPRATMCSGCSRPLVWLYSARKLAWISVTPDPVDIRTMHLHQCKDGIPQISWRDEHPAAGPDSPERVAAREVAAAAKGRNAVPEGNYLP